MLLQFERASLSKTRGDYENFHLRVQHIKRTFSSKNNTPIQKFILAFGTENKKSLMYIWVKTSNP